MCWVAKLPVFGVLCVLFNNISPAHIPPPPDFASSHFFRKDRARCSWQWSTSSWYSGTMCSSPILLFFLLLFPFFILQKYLFLFLLSFVSLLRLPLGRPFLSQECSMRCTVKSSGQNQPLERPRYHRPTKVIIIRPCLIPPYLSHKIFKTRPADPPAPFLFYFLIFLPTRQGLRHTSAAIR